MNALDIKMEEARSHALFDPNWIVMCAYHSWIQGSGPGALAYPPPQGPPVRAEVPETFLHAAFNPENGWRLVWTTGMLSNPEITWVCPECQSRVRKCSGCGQPVVFLEHQHWMYCPSCATYVEREER